MFAVDVQDISNKHAMNTGERRHVPAGACCSWMFLSVHNVILSTVFNWCYILPRFHSNEHLLQI